MLELLPEFLLGFGNYFKTNLFIAFCTLIVGLLGGAILGFMHSRNGSILSKLASPVISLLRAFPVFVLMFVLWNFIPRSQNTSINYFISDPDMILILALSAFSVSSLSDIVSDALHFKYMGDSERVWLVIPNIFRTFVTLVLSTSIGAAIGVKEAVTYSLVFSDGLADRSDKLLLILIASILFALFFGISRMILDYMTFRFKAA
jgi:ABC-type amino acid transport system permease subunit